MRTFWLSSYTLWERELVRFFRQRSRVVGAIAPPIVFWFLIGSGLGGSFQVPGLHPVTDGASATYLQYFFPGTVMLIVLFTAIFSTISIIEDRHEGFLQSVMVAPMSRQGLVLGKILGGTTLAFVQGLLFLCLAPLAGITVHGLTIVYVLAMLFAVAFGLTGLGFLIAWKLDSTQGFHAIMNLFLIPMWLMSGALFPINGAPLWLRAVMRCNPLTYSVSAMQSHFFVNGHVLAPAIAGPLTSLLVTVAFGIVMFCISVYAAQRR